MTNDTSPQGRQLKQTSADTLLQDAKRITAWADDGKLADDEWLVENNEDAIVGIARAYIKAVEALTEIAAYDDVWGNKRLEVHGTYSSFDEPGSVQIARAALANDGKPVVQEASAEPKA